MSSTTHYNVVGAILLLLLELTNMQRQDAEEDNMLQIQWQWCFEDRLILKNGRNRRLPSEIAIRAVRLQSDEGREREREAGNGDCNLARGQS